MAIHVALHHKTHYRYDRPVVAVAARRPAAAGAALPHADPELFAAASSRAKHFLNWQQDPHSNYLARLVFPEPTRELSVEVDLVAEMTVINPFDFFLEPSAESFRSRTSRGCANELAPYLETLPAAVRSFASSGRRDRRRTPKSARSISSSS